MNCSPSPRPDDQRALLARADEHVGLVEAHRDERVVPLELVVGGAHGLGEVALVEVGDQVRDHLGVGLGAEVRASVEQAALELDVVLDDPVDDDVDAVAVVGVRVRVLLADAPVGGPARVADARRWRAARRPRRRRLAPSSFSRSAPRLPTARTASIRSPAITRDPRGVITAVFEPRQPGEQQVTDGAPADVANDAAHRVEDTKGRRASRAAGCTAASAARRRAFRRAQRGARARGRRGPFRGCRTRAMSHQVPERLREKS